MVSCMAWDDAVVLITLSVIVLQFKQANYFIC